MSRNIQKIFFSSVDFNAPLILCVSGGKDSVSMLDIALKRKNEFKQKLEIVHFNHGIRDESRDEQEFVKKLGKKHKVPVEIIKLNVEEYAKEKGLSTEQAARKLRYLNLNKITKKRKNKGFIFTAHTATDQMETLFLRLIKGTGRKGLQGIRRENKLDSGWIVKRPLLDVTSQEIKNYIEENNIEYCVDKSNFDESIPRNLIRHKINSQAKKINPSVEKTMVKEADIFSQEEDFLNQVVEDKILDIKTYKHEKKIYIELTHIISYNKFLFRRIIRRLSPVELDSVKSGQIIDICRKEGASKHINIGKGWSARKEYKNLIFEKNLPHQKQFEYKLNKNGQIDVKEAKRKVKTSLVAEKLKPEKNPYKQIYDADKLDLKSLKVRSRKPGDRIRLLGLGGEKKVKDVLIDLKVPLKQRNRVLIFTDNHRILWVSPYRRADCAQVTKDTKRTLKIEVEDEQKNIQ